MDYYYGNINVNYVLSSLMLCTNESMLIAVAGPVITILDMLCRMTVNSEARLASTTLVFYS